MANNIANFPIPIFGGENYDFWKITMKTLLKSHGLWNYVDEGYQEHKDESSLSDSQKKKLETERMQDAKALYLIQNALTNSIFPKISELEDREVENKVRCSNQRRIVERQQECGIKLKGRKHVDVNSFQVSGVRGVYEDKSFKLEEESYVYMRVDVPTSKKCIIKEMESNKVVFSTSAVEFDTPYEDTLRSYMGMLMARCDCCLYELDRYDVRDGVLRLLARKTVKTVPSSNTHIFEAPRGYTNLGHH